MVEKEQSSEGSRPTVSGVGGWLLILVVVMLVVGPTMSIYKAFVLLISANPYLDSFSNLRLYKLVVSATTLVLAGTSFYAGMCLAVRRDQSAVSTAKWTLWLTGPVGVVLVGGLYPLVLLGKTDFPSLLNGTAGSALGAVLWTIYLSKSKRVRMTYGAADVGPS
jgi:uncharacterized protein DUF2569